MKEKRSSSFNSTPQGTRLAPLNMQYNLGLRQKVKIMLNSMKGTFGQQLNKTNPGQRIHRPRGFSYVPGLRQASHQVTLTEERTEVH